MPLQTSWRDGRRALPRGREVLLGLGVANRGPEPVPVQGVEIRCEGGEAVVHREASLVLAPGEERVLPVRIRGEHESRVWGEVLAGGGSVPIEPRSLPVSLVDLVRVRALGTVTNDVQDVHVSLEVDDEIAPARVDVRWLDPAGIYEGPIARTAELAPRAVLDYKVRPATEVSLRLAHGGLERDCRVPVESMEAGLPAAESGAPLAGVDVHTYRRSGYAPVRADRKGSLRIENRRTIRLRLRLRDDGRPLREVHVAPSEHVTVLKERILDGGRAAEVHFYSSAAAIWPVPITLAMDLVYERGEKRRITRRFVVRPRLRVRLASVTVFVLLALPPLMADLQKPYWALAGYLMVGALYLGLSTWTSPEILAEEIFEGE